MSNESEKMKTVYIHFKESCKKVKFAKQNNLSDLILLHDVIDNLIKNDRINSGKRQEILSKELG